MLIGLANTYEQIENKGIVLVESKPLNYELEIKENTAQELEKLGFKNVVMFNDSFTSTTKLDKTELSENKELIEYFFNY